jgi:hypothetical protein
MLESREEIIKNNKAKTQSASQGFYPEGVKYNPHNSDNFLLILSPFIHKSSKVTTITLIKKIDKLNENPN